MRNCLKQVKLNMCYEFSDTAYGLLLKPGSEIRVFVRNVKFLMSNKEASKEAGLLDVVRSLVNLLVRLLEA